MRDLRRQALESRKTVSRKAQSRVASQSSGESSSRVKSKNHIRFDPDIEKKTSGDSLDNSGIVAANLPPDTGEIWVQNLGNHIEEITHRRKSNIKDRENALSHYTNLLSSHYASDEIQRKTVDIFPALIKSIKAENSEKETCHASHALALTFITAPSEEFYDVTHQGLKNALKNSRYSSVKASAIHTLSIAAIYGGASDCEINEIIEEFLSIVESDGHSVDAADEAEVVSAACQALGYLATYLDNLGNKSEIAMDAFLEQLHSSDISVKVAAGENIALLYEKSHDLRQRENGPTSVEDEENDIDSRSNEPCGIYYQRDQLLYTLKELANESSKSVAKKDRKALHSIFSDVLNTVEYPNRGPRYQSAIDDQTGRQYGSRMTVRIQKTMSLRIDKWWKLHRLQALKRILGGGFVVHYQHNEAIFDSLPTTMSGG